jgi:hypothetical protein
LVSHSRKGGVGTTHLVGKVGDEEVKARDEGANGDDVEAEETKALVETRAIEPPRMPEMRMRTPPPSAGADRG